ncbi:MAG: 4Fe-4S dicluster domain-containing protein [Nitrospirae bacterium]|nr:4Fe-4S dicluster domain-containing protein [Nitrospirota bacterium]
MDDGNAVNQKNDEKLVPIHIMGRTYEVPDSLTIMKAVEYAGHQYIRGCGCRGGICGACGTFYRLPGDYQLQTALACQTVVQPGMMIMQLPYFPANRPDYDLETLNGKRDGNGVPPPSRDVLHESVRQMYPEVYRCVGCATCSRTCPMDIDVMDYVALIGRGDLEKATEVSFSCIMCGLCAIRCPAQISQYTAAMYVRRLTGRYLTPKAEHLRTRVTQVQAGQYDAKLARLRSMRKEELVALYAAREREPDLSKPGEWKPKETAWL